MRLVEKLRQWGKRNHPKPRPYVPIVEPPASSRFKIRPVVQHTERTWQDAPAYRDRRG